MRNDHPHPDAASLCDRLKAAIDGLPCDRISVGEIRDRFGADAPMMLTAFLTLVFFIPVSIPGVSTVFGAAIVLLTLSRLSGRGVWLPRKVTERSLPAGRLRTPLERGLRIFQRLERMSRPHRLSGFTSTALARRANDAGLLVGALLLMAPFGMIPLSNTIPAAALLLLVIGTLQHDGLSVLLGHAANALSIAYFGLLIGGGGVLLREALQRVLN